MAAKALLETTIDISREFGRDGDLLLVAGPGYLHTYPLAKPEVLIGRAPECDVVIEHRALSRRHAALQVRPLAIQDLGSTNGIRLANRVLQSGDPVELRTGESFHIGPFSFLVIASQTNASEPRAINQLIVDDPTIGRVSELIHQIARHPVNVLIQGETGVGKEVLAATIHELSGRTGPMCRINCAALSEALLESELFGHEKGAFTGAASARAGLLEAAAGGSVFLDEIGELPIAVQAKLLRAVEAREIVRLGSTRPIQIDVRFISATNRELSIEVSAGRFRHDLYFRIDGVSLRIPPLRDRAGAIAPLTIQFIEEAARRAGRTVHATPGFVTALEAHHWPGNVRELKAVVERAVLLASGQALAVHHLAFTPRVSEEPTPAPITSPPVDPATVATTGGTGSGASTTEAVDLSYLTIEQREDRDRVIEALHQCSGNQTRAAKLLGIARTTLVNKLAVYRIPRPRS